MKYNYPKILIIGEYFNLRSGGGITMTNLFKGWDKENIAVAHKQIDDPDFTICQKYYQLGKLENRRIFPFNLNRWGKIMESGVVYEKDLPKIITPFNEHKKSKLRDIYDDILQFIGVPHFKSRFTISNEFLHWIKEYSPDIIYSQLSTLPLIRLVNNLHTTLGIPVVIHIMDDWPTIITMNGLFKKYWNNKIDKEFRCVLSHANILMSISDSMSEEYMTRYGKNFIPFHNPIDIKLWTLFSKKNYELNGTFIILYAGRIGLGLQYCFLDIAAAIKDLIIKGLKIEFWIQATNYHPVLEELKKFNFIKLKDAVPYSELPGIFAESDLLLLPNDFDRKSISFLRYSMPTKASEYMASGSPILLYSSIETAVTKHALKNKWAYVVSENTNDSLTNAIFKLYHDPVLRKDLGERAKEFAIKNEDAEVVREKFREAFDFTKNPSLPSVKTNSTAISEDSHFL